MDKQLLDALEKQAVSSVKYTVQLALVRYYMNTRQFEKAKQTEFWLDCIAEDHLSDMKTVHNLMLQNQRQLHKRITDQEEAKTLKFYKYQQDGLMIMYVRIAKHLRTLPLHSDEFTIWKKKLNSIIDMLSPIQEKMRSLVNPITSL